MKRDHPLRLRPASPDDSRRIWEWRNDPRTRAASRNVDLIAWDQHRAWYRQALADPNRILLVVEVGAEPAGVLRFDETAPGRWTVSINLAPAVRGRNLGAQSLVSGLEWLRRHALVTRLDAEIRSDNRASIRVFEAAGYAFEATDDGWLRYVLVVDD